MERFSSGGGCGREGPPSRPAASSAGRFTIVSASRVSAHTQTQHPRALEAEVGGCRGGKASAWRRVTVMYGVY